MTRVKRCYSLLIDIDPTMSEENSEIEIHLALLAIVPFDTK